MNANLSKRLSKSRLAENAGEDFVSSLLDNSKSRAARSHCGGNIDFGIFDNEKRYTLFFENTVVTCCAERRREWNVKNFFSEFRKFGQKHTEIEYLVLDETPVWTKNSKCYISIFNLLLYVTRQPTTLGGNKAG